MKRSAGAQMTTFVAMLIAALFISGCGGANSPVAPGASDPDTTARASNADAGRMLWGFYTVEIDPNTLEVSTQPLRTAEFNANVTKFMQPPASPIHMMTVQVDTAKSDIPSGLLVLDVTLKHPFIGLNLFRGFDVRGIFMANASKSLGYDPAMEYANWSAAGYGIPASEPVLLNADGYTRWWNPTEFTDYGIIFGYTHGDFAPDTFLAAATLNPYKCFADGLEEEDPFEIDPSTRATFGLEPGFNRREYAIQFSGTPWLYNYAIDASWAKPDESGAPSYPPESFPPEANCQEAYKIALRDANSTTWYQTSDLQGGDFIFDLEVYDWQADGASINPSVILEEVKSIWVESPAFDDGSGGSYFNVMAGDYELLPGSVSNSAILRFTVQPDFSEDGIDAAVDYPVMIAVESAHIDTYKPQIGDPGDNFTYPDGNLAAYGYGWAPVSGISTEHAPEVYDVIPGQGAPGDLLTGVEVHGKYFQNGATVEFKHAVDAYVIPLSNTVFVDDTLINVDLDLTGAHMGFYDVTVHNPDSQSGTLSLGFEVTEMLKPVLVLEDEIVFNPTNGGYNMYTPAIIVENDGDVTFAYEEWLWNGTSNTSYASAFRSQDDGLTFPTWEWSFVSWGWHHHADVDKIWPSASGTSYRTLNLIDPDETQFATGFFATTISGPYGGEYAHISHSIFHANEILQDAEKYIYAIGDYGGSIQFKRSETPDCINCGPSDSVWQSFPVYPLASPGTLSRARSSALYNGTMYLAYFEDGNNIIRLAKAADYLSWDTSTVIWDGTDSGTAGARDPGLQIDDTGYYVTFVRNPEATDHDQLCYTYSSDGTSWSEPAVIYEGGDMFSILDSPIIHYDWEGTSTLGTVWWEGDLIRAAFSIDDGATWSDPVLVSEMWSKNKQSDLAIRDDTDNWHFVYSALNPDTGLWQIQYRRGHMEWQ